MRYPDIFVSQRWMSEQWLDNPRIGKVVYVQVMSLTETLKFRQLNIFHTV